MPASKQTANFELPQYAPLDTVSALVTFNGAMGKIDAALQEIKTTADAGSVDINDITNQVAQIETNLNAIQNQISALATTKYTNTAGEGITGGIWGIGVNSMLVRFNVGCNFIPSNAQKTPGFTGGYNAYTLGTLPQNIFNITNSGPSNVLNLSRPFAAQQGDTDGQYNYLTQYYIGAWRENNITYIGLCVPNIPENKAIIINGDVIYLF